MPRTFARSYVYATLEGLTGRKQSHLQDDQQLMGDLGISVNGLEILIHVLDLRDQGAIEGDTAEGALVVRIKKATVGDLVQWVGGGQ